MQHYTVMCVHTPGEVAVLTHILFTFDCCNYLPNLMEICKQLIRYGNKLLAYFVATVYKNIRHSQ